jgi:ketosteroid isomerase-like protein
MKTVVGLLALGGFCMAPAFGMADEAAIAERVASFEAAFNAGDAAGVAAHYSTDAVIMPPDVATIHGRDGAEALWTGFIEAGASDLDLTTVMLEVKDAEAHEMGSFSINVPDGNGGTMAVKGKYVIVWTQDDAGVWNLNWDIWNNDPAG